MKDMQCDSKISKHSLEQLIEILEARINMKRTSK
jgi:hypothetical protein